MGALWYELRRRVVDWSYMGALWCVVQCELHGCAVVWTTWARCGVSYMSALWCVSFMACCRLWVTWVRCGTNYMGALWSELRGALWCVRYMGALWYNLHGRVVECELQECVVVCEFHGALWIVSYMGAMWYELHGWVVKWVTWRVVECELHGFVVAWTTWERCGVWVTRVCCGVWYMSALWSELRGSLWDELHRCVVECELHGCFVECNACRRDLLTALYQINTRCTLL
jgi:hypothetical protein